MDEKSAYLTSAQIRAARAWLNWTAGELASRAGLGITTIQRAEAEGGAIKMTRVNMEAVRRTFEAAGVRFTDDGGIAPTTPPAAE